MGEFFLRKILPCRFAVPCGTGWGGSNEPHVRQPPPPPFHAIFTHFQPLLPFVGGGWIMLVVNHMAASAFMTQQLWLELN